MKKFINNHPLISILVLAIIVIVLVRAFSSPVSSSSDKSSSAAAAPNVHESLIAKNIDGHGQPILSPNAVEINPFIQNSSTNYNRVYKGWRYTNDVFIR